MENSLTKLTLDFLLIIKVTQSRVTTNRVFKHKTEAERRDPNQ